MSTDGGNQKKTPDWNRFGLSSDEQKWSAPQKSDSTFGSYQQGGEEQQNELFREEQVQLKDDFATSLFSSSLGSSCLKTKWLRVRDMVFTATFNNISVYIVAVNFIVGGDQRKPPTWHKSMTNFIT
jgi:hypothetical protein